MEPTREQISGGVVITDRPESLSLVIEQTRQPAHMELSYEAAVCLSKAIVLIDMQSFFLGFPWEESLRNDGGGQTTQFISTRQFGVREEAHMVVWVRYSRESVRISTVQEDAGSIVSPLALDNFGHAFELARAINNLVKDKPVAQDLQFEILDSWPPDPDSSIYS